MREELDSEKDKVGFVPAVFARDLDEADFYRSLLDDQGIEVRVDEDFRKDGAELADSKEDDSSIAVLVDSEHLAEAEAIIQERLVEEDFHADGEGGDDDDDGDENEFEGLEEFNPDHES